MKTNREKEKYKMLKKFYISMLIVTIVCFPTIVNAQWGIGIMVIQVVHGKGNKRK